MDEPMIEIRHENCSLVNRCFRLNEILAFGKKKIENRCKSLRKNTSRREISV